MASRLERINQQRQEKLERLHTRGINPYPHRYHRSHTAQQAVALLEQQESSSQTEVAVATVAGRIMANRAFGKISFLDIHDSTGKMAAQRLQEPLIENEIKL